MRCFASCNWRISIATKSTSRAAPIRPSATSCFSVSMASIPHQNYPIQAILGNASFIERTATRKTGRTSKTFVGARRQTIVTSVLESLRNYLTTFTLTSVIEEFERWWKAGQSCFTALLNKLKFTLPEKPIIDRLFPKPSG